MSLSSDLVVRDPSPSPVRRGQFAALDPSGRLVAVTDSLGRVVVVDALARHVIRLFKGYRAAQVRAAGLPCVASVCTCGVSVAVRAEALILFRCMHGT